MTEILSEAPTRTEADVVADVKAIMDGIDGDGAGLEMTLAMLDFALLRGFVARGTLIQRAPWMLKCRRLTVRLRQDYNGPPRITAVLPDHVSAAVVEQQHDDALKAHFWSERDAALRRGVHGTALT